jgi:prephenate dehydrogenase
MTRLAGSSAEMWTAIFDDNAGALLDAVDSCQGVLGALRRAVERHDRLAVTEAFRVAHAWMEPTVAGRRGKKLAGGRR